MDEEIQIPGYQLLDKIGEGARGTVYRAQQLSLDRLVAVKVLWPNLAADAEYTATFFHEARAAARLAHPNIVQAFEVGVHEGVCFFVMELVEGGSLHEHLARGGPMRERQALELALQMAQALDFAWRRAGIIHRDIKPANILLTPEGQPKLADLGLAIRHGSQSAPQDYVEGTPQYCAPEQCRGEPNLDSRTDLYALGATLYHMVCGRPPFDDSDPAKVLAMQVSQPPEPPRRLNPGISAELETVILKLLAKNPADRYQSPAELVEAIEQARARIAAAAAAPRPVVVVRPDLAASAPQTTPSRARKAWAWLGGSALALFGLSGLALMAVLVLRPDWIRSIVTAPSEPVPLAEQPTSIAMPAAKAEPRPPAKTARRAVEPPVQTAPVRTTKTTPPSTRPAPATQATPPAATAIPTRPSAEEAQKFFDTVAALVKTNNHTEAVAMLQKALDQWGDVSKLRARIETTWQDVQTAHIAYEKKRAEETAAQAATEKTRREQLDTDLRATVAQIEPWQQAFYFEQALQLLCATLAKTDNTDLRAALQDKVTELQLLCELKKRLIAAVKGGRLQTRALPLTSGTPIEGRPAEADADGLSVALGHGTGMIQLSWNRFTEPAIYSMLQEASASGDGQTMAAMALYAWETGRDEDARRYFDLAKAALANKLPAVVKRRGEQG